MQKMRNPGDEAGASEYCSVWGLNGYHNTSEEGQEQSSRRQPLNALQPLANGRFGGFQVIGRLQVEPVFGRLSERLAKQQCQLRRHRARSLDDIRNTHGGNVDGTGKGRLRQVEFFENFRKEFSGVYGCKAASGHGVISSMVIRDFNVEGVAVLEPEAQPPLPVDADTVLARPLAFEGFEIIRRRQAQILNSCGSIQLIEPHGRPLQDLPWQPPGLASLEKLPGFRIGKRPYHGNSYKQVVYNRQEGGKQ